MMKSKAILDVIDQRKILSSLANSDDIHKISRVGCISVDLAINLNEFCMQIFSTPSLVGAYLSLFLRKMLWGKRSLSLWGLLDEWGTNTPVSISSMPCSGAATCFRSFLGPQVMAVLGMKSIPLVFLTLVTDIIIHAVLQIKNPGFRVPPNSCLSICWLTSLISFLSMTRAATVFIQSFVTFSYWIFQLSHLVSFFFSRPSLQFILLSHLRTKHRCRQAIFTSPISTNWFLVEFQISQHYKCTIPYQDQINLPFS